MSSCLLVFLFSCSDFEARPVDSEVGTQPLLHEPRTVTAHYAAGDSEEGDGKVCLPIISAQDSVYVLVPVVSCLFWLLPEAACPQLEH